MSRRSLLNLGSVALALTCLLLPIQKISASELNVQIKAHTHPEVVKSFVESYFAQHKPSSEQTFDELSLSLTHALHESGYVLATIVAEPHPKSNDLVMVVHLGEIKKIAFTGFNSPKTEESAKAIIENLILNQTAHLARLERAMMLINDLGGVSSTYHLYELSPGTYQMTISNSGAPSATSLQLDYPPTTDFKRQRLNVAHTRYGVFKGGDALRVSATGIRGNNRPSQIGGELYYRAPIGTNGLFGSVSASDLRSRIEQVTQQDLQFDGKNFAVTLGYPLVRNSHGYEYIIGELQSTEEKIEGFASNNDVEVARIIFVHKSSDNQANLFNASVSATLGKGDRLEIQDFTHIRGALGKVWNLNHLSSGLHFRADSLLQLADSPLPASEQFYLGSTRFLRGYSFGSEAGDSGAVFTVELDKTIVKPPLGLSRLRHGTFVDMGIVKNSNGSAQSLASNGLVSIGYQFEMLLGQRFTLKGWAAAPLEEDRFGRKEPPNLYLQLQTGW